MLPKRRSLRVPSLGTQQRASSPVKSRWLVRVLARLVIAASCTSSAAALDAQIERGKCFSSANSLWKIERIVRGRHDC